jgi:hypothetical protein
MAWGLRLGGLSFGAIADELGFGCSMSARNAVHRGSDLVLAKPLASKPHERGTTQYRKLKRRTLTKEARRERDAKGWELRKQGLSYPLIARELDLGAPGHARSCVLRGAREAGEEDLLKPGGAKPSQPRKE